METKVVSAQLYDDRRCPLCGREFTEDEETMEVVAIVQFPAERKGGALRVRLHRACGEREVGH